MNRFAVVAIALLVSGCSKKDDASNAPLAAAAASTDSVAVALSDAGALDGAPTQTAIEIPEALWASGANTSPGFVPPDPYAVPTHVEYDQEATLEIHKGNYKAELEKLEKEDVTEARP